MIFPPLWTVSSVGPLTAFNGVYDHKNPGFYQTEQSWVVYKGIFSQNEWYADQTMPSTVFLQSLIQGGSSDATEEDSEQPIMIRSPNKQKLDFKQLPSRGGDEKHGAGPREQTAIPVAVLRAFAATAKAAKLMAS